MMDFVIIFVRYEVGLVMQHLLLIRNFANNLYNINP